MLHFGARGLHFTVTMQPSNMVAIKYIDTSTPLRHFLANPAGRSGRFSALTLSSLPVKQYHFITRKQPFAFAPQKMSLTLGVSDHFNVICGLVNSFDNPGGGTSTIITVGEDKLSYMRGKSRFFLSYSAIFDAFRLFSGMTTTTNDLKKQRLLSEACGWRHGHEFLSFLC